MCGAEGGWMCQMDGGWAWDSCEVEAVWCGRGGRGLRQICIKLWAKWLVRVCAAAVRRAM